MWSALIAFTWVFGAAWVAHAAPLIIDGTTPAQTSCPGGTPVNGGRGCNYGGVHEFDYIDIRNGGVLTVVEFNGTDRVNTGNLVLKATGRDPTNSFSIRVDVTSRITAKGSGYQGKLCDDGPGPSAFPLAGGRGGCSVLDSGGGGGHFGRGGRGTKDCFVFGSATSCEFPQEFEEDCGDLNGAGNACVATTEPGFATCRGFAATPTNQTTGAGNGLPDVAGQAYYHHILDIDFGAAGGDKGCLDSFDNALRAGDGGGRVVLFGATPMQNGIVNVAGRVIADGKRGCSSGNDSAGAGAGGVVLIIGDEVNIADTARVSAHGGRGGDSQPKCLPCTTPGSTAGCGSGQTCTAYTEPASGKTYNLCGPCNCTPCTSNANCTFPGQTCKNLGGSLGNVCADASNQCTPYDVGDDESECSGTQNSGTCDDRAGGGGGGIINVQSRVASIHPSAIFDVRGGKGGICPICAGEAGGGAGELQLVSAYVGEICDGKDNNFDGNIDEGLPDLNCGGTLTPSCVGGKPVSCTPDPATCTVTATDARPRFALILDSSGSMLLDINGNPTFGDGSLDYPGINTSAPGAAGQDSRLFIAKSAVAKVLAAFPESDYALARYYQDVGTNRSCQTASNFECAKSCCSYDDPTNNTTPAYPNHYPDNRCVLSTLYPSAGYSFPNPGNTSDINIGWQSPGADCINYAGSCGPPERGAQFLVDFSSPLGEYLKWLDGAETDFRADTIPGQHCQGGDCELRATGPTPLAGALAATQDFLTPVVTCDSAKACRTYATILLTDGAESCQGDPAAAAAALRTAVPGKEIKTYVIGFSVAAAERAQLNAIAAAGGTNAGDFTGQPDAAFFADDEDGLANAIATIIASSQRFESCNDADDDCDTLVDEDFPNKGLVCDDGQLGLCRGTGAYQCKADGSGTECVIDTPGATPTNEICNGLDDNCNGFVDEGISCGGCVPEPEVCNGKDDDCDKSIDEEPDVSMNDPNIGGECDPLTAPNDKDPCKPGRVACINGQPVCTGAVKPGTEICNGKDDDCDGTADNQADCPGVTECIEGVCVAPCGSGEFKCPGGFECREGYCFPLGCDGVDCPAGQECVNGLCVMQSTGGAGGGSSGGSAGAGATGGTAGTSGNGGNGGVGGTAGNAGAAGSATAGTAGSAVEGDEVYGLATGGGGASCSLSLERRSAWPAGAGLLLLGLLWRRRRRTESGAAKEVAR
ncbi:MAG: MopE-related protein [Polyangiaceae bacterium]